MKTVKELIGQKTTGFRIYESYIEVENIKFFWSEIEQIKFKRRMQLTSEGYNGQATAEASEYPSLSINLKNGEFLEKKLPTTNYYTTKPFLFGLAWVSQFTSVFFYTEHEKEYGLIKSFNRNYQGNIEIGVPKQLCI